MNHKKKLSSLKKTRANFLYDPSVLMALKSASDETGRSMSELANAALKERFTDPIKRMKRERKELMIKITELSTKILELEKLDPNRPMDSEDF